MSPIQGLTLYCLECEWQVQVAQGTPVSALRSDCLICKANVGIRSEAITPKKTQMEPPQVSHPDITNEPSFLPIFKHDDRVMQNLVDPGESDDQFLIDSFVSRITPLVLAAKVVAELKRKSMDDSSQETDMETILNEFAEQGVALRSYIRKHERKSRHKR